MQILKGMPVSPGIVIGEAFVLGIEEYRMPKKAVPPELIEAEVKRFEEAAARVENEILSDIARVEATIAGEHLPGIFQGHVAILREMKPQISDQVRKYRFPPEHAISKHFRKIVKLLTAREDPTGYVSRILTDFADVERRLLRSIFGKRGGSSDVAGQKSVIFARDLTPSQTISLDRSKILGFVTELGGRTSHTAILARAQGIPAVVGIQNITSDVSGGDTVIVDGSKGMVIIDPDDETIKKYRAQEKNFQLFEKRTVEEMRSQPAETRDGISVSLLGNIELPEEASHAREFGANGIGLFRTEFLVLDPRSMPTEKEHFDAYRRVLTLMEGRPVTVRALDLGADKDFDGHTHGERNPFLGCRGIRYLFERMDLLRTQLRAVLRASAHGKIRLMFPMVATADELKQAKAIIADVREELDREGAGYDPHLEIGAMIEVPSAAIAADLLCAEADFLSIGTNDLVQYVLAVDRVNEKIAALYQPAHPAVLRLIRQVIDAGIRSERPVSMCGEMSGDPLFTALLLGMGLRSFSAVPTAIPEIKKVLRSITVAEAKEIAREALALTDTHSVLEYLTEKTKRIIPELF